MIFSNCTMRPRRSRNPNSQNAWVCIVVSAMQKQYYAVITAVTCYDCFRKNLYFSLCRCILSALILLLHVIPLLLQPFFVLPVPFPYVLFIHFLCFLFFLIILIFLHFVCLALFPSLPFRSPFLLFFCYHGSCGMR